MHLINTVLQLAINAMPKLGYTEFSEASGLGKNQVQHRTPLPSQGMKEWVWCQALCFAVNCCGTYGRLFPEPSRAVLGRDTAGGLRSISTIETHPPRERRKGRYLSRDKCQPYFNTVLIQSTLFGIAYLKGDCHLLLKVCDI